ncbi:MAG TPA: amidohydrolase family protein [Longimicrobiales bacterium]
MPLDYRLEFDDGTAIGITGGRIADPNGRFDLVVPLGPGELRPGLINAHDHLHRNHYPRLGAPPYRDAYAWGTDLHTRYAAELDRLRALGRREALLFGALKNLVGGVTTVVHHDPWEPAFDIEFPVHVVRVRTVHSLRFERDFASAVAGDVATRARPMCIHLAEGTNREAAEEVRELATLGLLDRRVLAVHVVGVDHDGIQRARAAGIAIVWCPTSNHFLFERTAPPALLAPGVDVLLGSDALLTGDGTLLDELRAARRLGYLDDARLLDAVGAVAARRLGCPEPSLATGASADLVVLRRPLFEARAADVALVIVSGTPCYGDERFGELFERAGVSVESLRVGGVRKVVAAPLAAVAERVVELAPTCGRIFD